MADLLVQHLKLKSESHSALQSLFSQWDFDQKLIPKALQTVGVLFPHYSRHDESHSRQILVNIERLLGNNLSLLTATDTWLLLEAAYWHDIGMVVPQKDIEETLSNPEFDAFLQTFVLQPHHELHAVALALKAKSRSFQIFFNEAPLDTVTRFRELMAEWFRRKHPARAEYIVNSPHRSVGISSPRTELIPARLFSVLGRICSMHGASFEALVGPDGLSFREAGMGRDDCHPRFVACLLRLGDLLDLDDNRFCPVMQGIAGKDRPALSKAHEDKHAAIRHLRIDQERISIEAECQTVDGYLESFRWFGWLKEEMQAQMSRWRDIVPNRELGLLPMLGPVSVRLAGNLKIIKDGERPAFTLDTLKAIELLQGENLYDSEYACIRELLQNSVDATLLKIWMTSGIGSQDPFWDSPEDEAVKALLRSATIQVSLTESENCAANAVDMSSWTLTIRDYGTGISIDDLQYMLQIGGSYRNKNRRKKIDAMPEWMKPAGVFGIGFQSIFMLCDRVSLKTKSLMTNDILEVTMYSPTGSRDGLVVIQLLEPDVSEPSGTSIKICFEREKFAKTWSMPMHDEDSIVHRVIKTLDPVLDESFPFKVAKLADNVREFSENSMIRIEGVLKTLTCSYPLHRELNELSAHPEANPWRFVKTQDFELRIRYRPQAFLHQRDEIKTFYRGQLFDVKDFVIPHVVVEVDLLSGSAGEWLNFSRDKVSAAGVKNLQSIVLDGLEIAVREDILACEKGESPWAFKEKRRPATSFFLKSMAMLFAGAWIDHSRFLSNDWLDLKLGKDSVKFRSFFEKDEWVVTFKEEDEKNTAIDDGLLLNDNSYYKVVPIAMYEWQRLPNKFIQILGNQRILIDQSSHVDPNDILEAKNEAINVNELTRCSIRFSSRNVDSYDNAAIAGALAKLGQYRFSNMRIKACLGDRFSGLYLANPKIIHARNLFPLFPINGQVVLLPFLFKGAMVGGEMFVEATSEQIERLCHWVKPRLKRSAELEEVRRLYEELIQWIDYEVMGATVYSENWLLARGLKGSAVTG